MWTSIFVNSMTTIFPIIGLITLVAILVWVFIYRDRDLSMPTLLLKITLGLVSIFVLLTAMRWFASIDGVATIEIEGREISIRTSALLGLTALAFAVVWVGVYILRRGVGGLASAFDFFNRRRHRRGLQSLSRTMIALAEGDGPRALRDARKAEALLDDPDLTRLLVAQSAKLSGDVRLAEKYYEAMSEDRDTDFLGVQGLLSQALRENKPERALRLAERAHALRPRQPEILDALFDLQRKKGDWSSARDTVQASVRAKRLTRDVGERRRAVLHLGEAQSSEERGDAAGALREAMASVRLAPGLAPAAAMAARLLTAEGEKRSASKILVQAWRQSPHPDLAASFAGLAPDETPYERLQRFGRLFETNPRHEESRLLKAELAVAADQLDEARDALGDLAETAPSARACALMAAIEQGQAAGDLIVKGWLSKAAAAPRGPQWVCEACGMHTTSWRATCSNCGAFDSLSWRRADPEDASKDAALFPLLATPPVLNSPANGAANGAAAPAKTDGALTTIDAPQPPARTA